MRHLSLSQSLFSLMILPALKLFTSKMNITFGVRSNFNNLYAFTKRVEMKQKNCKKGKSQHMIAYIF